MDTTLLLIGDQADPARHAQLLQAADAMHPALGSVSGFMERLSGRDLEYGGGAADIHDRSLSQAEVTDLALDVLDDFAQALPRADASTIEATLAGPLTEREQDVLRLVAKGLTSKQIGQQIFLSHGTVDHHLTSVFNKLGVDTRAQAVAVAAREGLL